MSEEAKKEDVEKVANLIKKAFQDAIEQGHYCPFKGRHVPLDEILGDEAQFRLCMWCRVNNLLVQVTALKMNPREKITDSPTSVPRKGDVNPTYIG